MKKAYVEEAKLGANPAPFGETICSPRRQLSDRLRVILSRLIMIDSTLGDIQNNLIGTDSPNNKREEPTTHYHAILLIESLVDDIEARVENLKEDLA